MPIRMVVNSFKKRMLYRFHGIWVYGTHIYVYNSIVFQSNCHSLTIVADMSVESYFPWLFGGSTVTSSEEDYK